MKYVSTSAVKSRDFKIKIKIYAEINGYLSEEKKILDSLRTAHVREPLEAQWASATASAGGGNNVVFIRTFLFYLLFFFVLFLDCFWFVFPEVVYIFGNIL